MVEIVSRWDSDTICIPIAANSGGGKNDRRAQIQALRNLITYFKRQKRASWEVPAMSSWAIMIEDISGLFFCSHHHIH
jgi:hypothetical protein